MPKFKTNFFEATIAVLTLLNSVGLCFYFYNLNNPDLTQDNPFATFNSNQGIINISVTSLILQILFLCCFTGLSYDKTKHRKVLLTSYLIFALLIGLLQWYELYYGSTFYYGEVRDKQGLSFPIMASLMITLVLWRVNYSKIEKFNTVIKTALTVVVNIGLYIMWTQVYESWNLWQS